MDLVLEGVRKSFGDREVLSGVDFLVRAGETVAIVGPSGSGKSTLLNIVGSLEQPTTGTVRLGEFEVWVAAGSPPDDRSLHPLKGGGTSAGGSLHPSEGGGIVESPPSGSQPPLPDSKAPKARARAAWVGGRRPEAQVDGRAQTEPCRGDLAAYRAKMVGFVFQEHLLLPQLTAVENVLLPTLALDAPADEGRARELLEAVGVGHRADAFPAQMSGGERQRVAIARAMVNRPALLLCDEPTGNLDQDTGAAIVELLLQLAQGGVAVLMATHNLEHAARFSRRVRLVGGRLEG